MLRVLTEPKNALIKQYRYLFNMGDVDFHISEKALKWISATALAKGTGARGLRSIMEEILLHAMYEVPDDDGIVAVSVDIDDFGEPSIMLLRSEEEVNYIIENEGRQPKIGTYENVNNYNTNDSMQTYKLSAPPSRGFNNFENEELVNF